MDDVRRAQPALCVRPEPHPRPRPSSLAPSGEAIETALIQAGRALRRFYDGLPARAARGSLTEPVNAGIPLGVPGAPAGPPPAEIAELGRPLEDVLGEVLETRAALAECPPHPGYAAYVSGGGAFHGALAALVAHALNPYVTISACAPGLVEIEVAAVRWLCQLAGLPGGSGGILTSGGSMATLSAIAAARERHLGPGFLDGRLYASSEAHHCLAKAARYAGFPPEAVVEVPVDPATLRIDVAALEQAIAADRRAGRRPFLVTATAGTTSTGSVDDLDAVGAVARRERLWYHVDAAYGGAFRLTTRGRARLRGMETADSIVVDPHKSLCLPYGLGALVVRDPAALRVDHARAASYMPPGTQLDAADLSPELSRDFRGLMLWLPLAVLGVRPFRENLEDKLDLTCRLRDALVADTRLRLVAEPDLTIVAFSVSIGAGRAAEEDEATRALLAALNARGTIYVSGCTAGGRPRIRVCLLNPRLDSVRVEAWLVDLRRSLTDLLPAPAANSRSPVQ